MTGAKEITYRIIILGLLAGWASTSIGQESEVQSATENEIIEAAASILNEAGAQVNDEYVSYHDVKPLSLWNKVKLTGLAMTDPKRFSEVETVYAVDFADFSGAYLESSAEIEDVFEVGMVSQRGEMTAIKVTSGECVLENCAGSEAIAEKVENFVSQSMDGGQIWTDVEGESQLMVFLREDQLIENLDFQELSRRRSAN